MFNIDRTSWVKPWRSWRDNWTRRDYLVATWCCVKPRDKSFENIEHADWIEWRGRHLDLTTNFFVVNTLSHIDVRKKNNKTNFEIIINTKTSRKRNTSNMWIKRKKKKTCTSTTLVVVKWCVVFEFRYGYVCYCLSWIIQFFRNARPLVPGADALICQCVTTSSASDNKHKKCPDDRCFHCFRFHLKAACHFQTIHISKKPPSMAFRCQICEPPHVRGQRSSEAGGPPLTTAESSEYYALSGGKPHEAL